MSSFQATTADTPASNSNDHARVLIEAFENLIIPIIHSNCSSSGTNPRTHGSRSRSGLTTEAQQLITALSQFVTSLVRPSAPVALPMTVAPVFPRRKPPLLQLALDTMHQKVFNRVPIRLLTFNSDGTNIRLIERGELWGNVSTAIEQNYDEERIKADMRRIELEQTQKKANNSTTQVQAVVEPPEKQAITNFLSGYCQYAILSHTWLQGAHGGEITYSNWKNGTFDMNSAGYRKLANFCRVAATDYHVTYGWMDTVCIDKTSSSELDESIRSMLRWYYYSHVCVTYLADTITLRDMRKDAWFTRGWTLQELIGPTNLKFYNSNWMTLIAGMGDDKTNDTIVDIIHATTDIGKGELHWGTVYSTPISRRMQWAAGRKVTREEDSSYSLMGLFGVSFPIAYGEGPEKAFFRLVEAILSSNTPNLLDVTNCGFGYDYPPHSSIVNPSWLIPRSLKQYTWRVPTNVQWNHSKVFSPVTLTHLGLRVSILLMPCITTDSRAPRSSSAFGDFYATILDVDFLQANNSITRHSFSLLDRSIYSKNSSCAQCFGLLNFVEYPNWVQLPATSSSFAIPLRVQPPLVRGVAEAEQTKFSRAITKAACAFDLKSNGNTWVIRKSDLQKHGMMLRTLYL